MRISASQRSPVLAFVAALMLALSVCTALPAEAATTSSLPPISDGTYQGWKPSTGSTHYTLVDEATCNGVTDYVSTATTTLRDSYGVSLASVPNGATITQISLTPCASRNSGGGGGSATLNVFYRYNGVNSADAGGYALTGTTPTGLAATNFTSLALVKSSTSTLEVGAVYSAGTKGARLSRLATVITYTPQAPFVTTGVATSITTTSGILNGAANPNGATTTGWFRYSTTNPGTCSDSFGTRAPSSGGTALGNGTTSVGFNRTVTGLTPATTYFYCAIASNVTGTSTGGVMSFTTGSPLPPTVTTNAATLVTATTSQLNGSANPNSATTTGWFRYATSSPGTCDDVFGFRAPSSGGVGLGNGTTSVAFSYTVPGLTPGTTYYYCAIASNSMGTSTGSVVSFTTP